MKSLYIFLSLVGIFFFNNTTAFAQTKESNEKIVHKAIDKMNYEFAIAVLKRIKRGDQNSVIEVNKKVTDTTFARVKALEPNIKANSIERMFSREKLSDGVTGYIYEINYIKLSPKYYPINDVLSIVQSLDKIVDKVVIRTRDFGDEQKAFTLKEEEIRVLKERLNKIKNAAIIQLNSNERIEVEIKPDTIKSDSVIEDLPQQDSIQQKEQTKTVSSNIIYYKINQEEEKELTGTYEAIEGEKPTYNFGLDIKEDNSIRIRVKGNSDLDTAFLVVNANNSFILEGQDNRYVIDLNIAKAEEDDYIMWIIFGIIAVSIIVFVIYKQSQKNKPIATTTKTKKNVIKKDPLSREDVAPKVAPPIVERTDNKEQETMLVQNQIKEEKNRLTTILSNTKLSDEQKLKEARSKNIDLEVANNLEIKELMRVIEEVSSKAKRKNTEEEFLRDNKIEQGKNRSTTQKTIHSPNTAKNYHEPLYVSLSDIGEHGIKSERKKRMSNTIFVIRPYSEGGNEAKKADFMLHSDIKDMAFESIFRSIEKLDHLIEHSTFTDTARKITQEEKGELIKEDNVWKVKKRLRVKFL